MIEVCQRPLTTHTLDMGPRRTPDRQYLRQSLAIETSCNTCTLPCRLRAVAVHALLFCCTPRSFPPRFHERPTHPLGEPKVCRQHQLFWWFLLLAPHSAYQTSPAIPPILRRPRTHQSRTSPAWDCRFMDRSRGLTYRLASPIPLEPFVFAPAIPPTQILLAHIPSPLCILPFAILKLSTLTKNVVGIVLCPHIPPSSLFPNPPTH